jgi:ubiquinone/menaquinone biosynthesis C-methylase UbiE/uncharacterized protein YbaR (Trm112 family)
MEFINKLRCPVTRNPLDLIDRAEFEAFSIPDACAAFGQLTHGLIDKSRQYFYPVFDGIMVLHEQYALFTGSGRDMRSNMSFDRKRVFDYYNEVNYRTRDSLKIYADSSKWVDFREVSSNYIRNSFKRASEYYPATGKYLLDIASGPIGLPEYMSLSDGYEYRICVDISINALIQAKINMEKAGMKGIFICGDIANIPLQDNICDTVLSQHTLYHLPKNDQRTAFNELYRVAKEGSKVVVVYSWFYHSWFMNISLNLIQLYRIIRHFSGKLFVRMVQSEPKLYFYSHSRRWFKKSFPFGHDIEYYCWRSVNKYFLDVYIHRPLFGVQILNKLAILEKKHSKFMGIFGDYPVLMVTKHKL